MRISPYGLRAIRVGVLAWLLTTVLVVGFGATPHADAASTMQTHGALQRHEQLGIIAHRGAAALAPENTLAAMQIAFAQGVEFVETDVHLTADKVPVLMHDPTLDRTTAGSGPVASHTLAQVQALEAGSWFDPEFAGEPVPTLDAFLTDLKAANVRALIELKGEWGVADLAATSQLLRDRGMVNRVALQSFELDTLTGLAELAPEFARIMLTREWDRGTVALAAELQVSAVGARAALLDERPELIAEIQRVGIGVLVYTLNSTRTWNEAVTRGVDLVITDDPIAFATWRESSGDPPAELPPQQ
ncbi:Glycerophosphoryl diester phosphodiesterase [Leucobacter sp. 7(1)]|uniref:glycerophosphodiester phosphodiesterase n=1 Tax=Leucobacter sp. 7(1) TaxID=1255613 RepID=UPI00097EF78B|nr:glycerophosphodiester phosphodiesterase family protein [Leucobacter sp. 7(1)]SJN09731.1 Glycerophosphoryl diester phosphodiesterase [Leucobacter sp. 7(1)]